MNKKLLGLALSLTLAATLGACNTGTDTTSPDEEGATDMPAATEEEAPAETESAE